MTPSASSVVGDMGWTTGQNRALHSPGQRLQGLCLALSGMVLFP